MRKLWGPHQPDFPEAPDLIGVPPLIENNPSRESQNGCQCSGSACTEQQQRLTEPGEGSQKLLFGEQDLEACDTLTGTLEWK